MKRTFQPKKRQRSSVHWLPEAHVYQERPQGHQCPPRQGPQEPDCLIVRQARRQCRQSRPGVAAGALPPLRGTMEQVFG